MTVVYQIVNSIAPPIMNSLFQFRCNTNNIEIFKKFRQNKAVRYGTEILTYRAPFVWANLHTKYKNANPANIYLFKVNNRNSRKRCELLSKLTIKTPERRRSGVFIVNFENISHLFLGFLLLTLSK